MNQIPTCCHPTNTSSTIWFKKSHHHCQLHEKKLRSTKSQLFLTPDPISTGIQGRKLITTQDKTLSNHKTHNYLWLLVAVKSYCYLDQKNCKKPLPPTLLRNEKKPKVSLQQKRACQPNCNNRNLKMFKASLQRKRAGTLIKYNGKSANGAPPQQPWRQHQIAQKEPSDHLDVLQSKHPPRTMVKKRGNNGRSRSTSFCKKKRRQTRKNPEDVSYEL